MVTLLDHPDNRTQHLESIMSIRNIAKKVKEIAAGVVFCGTAFMSPVLPSLLFLDIPNIVPHSSDDKPEFPDRIEYFKDVSPDGTNSGTNDGTDGDADNTLETPSNDQNPSSEASNDPISHHAPPF